MGKDDALFAVAHLTDYGYVGGHAEKAGDELTKVDRGPIGTSGARCMMATLASSGTNTLPQDSDVAFTTR